MSKIRDFIESGRDPQRWSVSASVILSDPESVHSGLSAALKLEVGEAPAPREGFLSASGGESAVHSWVGTGESRDRKVWQHPWGAGFVEVWQRSGTRQVELRHPPVEVVEAEGLVEWIGGGDTSGRRWHGEIRPDCEGVLLVFRDGAGILVRASGQGGALETVWRSPVLDVPVRTYPTVPLDAWIAGSDELAETLARDLVPAGTSPDGFLGVAAAGRLLRLAIRSFDSWPPEVGSPLDWAEHWSDLEFTSVRESAADFAHGLQLDLLALDAALDDEDPSLFGEYRRPDVALRAICVQRDDLEGVRSLLKSWLRARAGATTSTSRGEDPELSALDREVAEIDALGAELAIAWYSDSPWDSDHLVRAATIAPLDWWTGGSRSAEDEDGDMESHE